MATPLFPSSIIPPSQQGYSVQKGTNFIQSKLETGASRTRQDFGGACHIVEATFECTQKQYTTISGFIRDRLQDGTRIFRIPLLIDVPQLVNYQARLLDKNEKLSQVRGLLKTVTMTLEVLPNPVVSFGLICQNVSDERVVAGNNPDFNPTIFDQFAVGRQVLLSGCEGFADTTVYVNLDGTYTILSKPSSAIVVLNNAAGVNAAWTTLNGTVQQSIFPLENAGACILVPE